MSTAPEPDSSLLRPTFAAVDLDAYRRNLAALRAIVPQTSRLIAVLKADAYGHGAVPLAQVCDEDDVEMLAVALMEEAIEIATAGVSLPILILGPLHSGQVEEAITRKFIIGIVGPEELAIVAETAERLQRETILHLKLDSGMGRMGLRESDLEEAARLINTAHHLRLDAIYTHFANSGDPRDPFTEQQLAQFERMLERLKSRGVTAPLHHSANSGATMRRLVQAGDYARVGIASFGAEALDVGTSRLEPLLRWTTRIARLKTIAAGDAVGYGSTWKAERESRIATLPVGYADGYSRALSNRGSVLVRGKRVPVVGRVSMDLLTIDVTDVPEATVGDEVVLLGRQGDEEISADEMAKLIGTISYEVFCAISARVPRVYLERGVPVVRSKFIQTLEK